MHAGTTTKMNLRTLTPRYAAREISLLLLLLVLTAVSAVAMTVVASWRSLSAIERIVTVNEQAALLFRASDAIQIERGRTNNALLASGPASSETLAGIATPRRASQEVVGAAFDALARGGDAALGARVVEARRAIAALDAARAAVDLALAQPRAARDAALVQGWYEIASAALNALGGAWREASAAVAQGGDATMARYDETAYLAHQAREEAGVERAGLSAAMRSPGQATPAQLAGWAERRGRVDAMLRRIHELNPSEASAPGMAAATRAVQEHFSTTFTQARTAVLAHVAQGGPAPMPAAEWQAIGDRGLGTLVALRDAVLARAEAHLRERARAAMRTLVIDAAITLAVLGLALVLMLRLSQRLLRPLRGITQALDAIRGGTARPPLPAIWRPDDEAGVIVAAVRNLGDQMERREAEEAAARAAATRQAERVARLDALIRSFEADTAESLATVARAAGQLDGTAVELDAAARDGVALTQAVAGAADTAAGNTQVAASAAEELTASVSEISRQVTQATEIARRAVAEANRTDETMQGLSVAAERIGEVVQLISGIAGQTNLLALNATIEAARAGEAGKGFAVVASEVKSLAAQTAKATSDIAEQIASMRAVALSAVETVRGIGAVVMEIDTAAASIAAAVEQQGAATREIARSVSDVARSTSGVSEDTQAASGAAQRTGAISSDVRRASEAFNAEAARMRDRIGDFLQGVRAA